MNARFGAELPDLAANSSTVLCHEIAHLATRELHGHRCPVCQLFRAARRLMSRWFAAPRRLPTQRQRAPLVTKRTAPSCFDATLPA